MKINLKNVIKRLGQKVEIIKTNEIIVNHKPILEETIYFYTAVVQVPQLETITNLKLNYSLKYLQINTIEEIKINDFVIFNNIKYKIIQVEDENNYGFYKAICEEVK